MEAGVPLDSECCESWLPIEYADEPVRVLPLARMRLVRDAGAPLQTHKYREDSGIRRYFEASSIVNIWGRSSTMLPSFVEFHA